MKLFTLLQPAALLLCTSAILQTGAQSLPSCDSEIYCQGNLLHTIQQARIFNDSKSFVDLSMVHSANETLFNFNQLMETTNNNPTKEQIKTFVEENFNSGGELDPWTPSDFKSDPAFLAKISDEVVQEFARDLVNIWPNLARKVAKNVSAQADQHSLIPVPNGFIIPGGRFKELYYWDSYWIVEGLLLSEMTDTVRGMLENLLSLVDRFGFVPNGGRVYYLNRSQPPLLTLMVASYMKQTNDISWLEQHVDTLDKELTFWLNNRTTEVSSNGIKYRLAHYASSSGSPRPESYAEDIQTCSVFTDEEAKLNCYVQLKSGAESGWDFSSRWLFDSQGGTEANLTSIATTRVIPVDLNSFLCQAFKELSNLYKSLNDIEKTIKWLELSYSWQKSIDQVLYNKEDGIWYDYDMKMLKQRKIFYPSNFAPLWTESYDALNAEILGTRAAEYFKKSGIMDYQGGIPTSTLQSGEQWDFPNAWPPLQEIVIMGLKKTGSTEAVEVADEFARRWIEANMRGYKTTNEMFEKYDAVHSGEYGGGGEYTVQSGFGWTNGAALSLINKFYGSS